MFLSPGRFGPHTNHPRGGRMVAIEIGDGCPRRTTVAHSPTEFASLLRLFADVASEQGWEPGGELAAYASHSVCFALSIGEDIAGGLQLVRGNADGLLPCRSVWPELPLAGRLDVADVALLALRPEYRGRGDLFWLLCVEMWRYCRDNAITELWAEVTPANLRRYRRLGWPLQIAGPLRSHWGEDCYPCRMGVAEVAQHLGYRAEAQGPGGRYRRILARAHRHEETEVKEIPLVACPQCLP